MTSQVSWFSILRSPVYMKVFANLTYNTHFFLNQSSIAIEATDLKQYKHLFIAYKFTKSIFREPTINKIPRPLLCFADLHSLCALLLLKLGIFLRNVFPRQLSITQVTDDRSNVSHLQIRRTEIVFKPAKIQLAVGGSITSVIPISMRLGISMICFSDCYASLNNNGCSSLCNEY